MYAVITGKGSSHLHTQHNSYCACIRMYMTVSTSLVENIIPTIAQRMFWSLGWRTVDLVSEVPAQTWWENRMKMDYRMSSRKQSVYPIFQWANVGVVRQIIRMYGILSLARIVPMQAKIACYTYASMSAYPENYCTHYDVHLCDSSFCTGKFRMYIHVST